MAQGRESGSQKHDPFNMAEMWKKMSAGRSTLIDKDKLMKQHRKNVETLSQANALATETMKSLGQMQTDFLKRSFEDMASYMKDYAKNVTKNPVGGQSNQLKSHFNQLMEHNNKLANMIAQSNRKIYEVFQVRFKESAEELKDVVGKAKKG